MKVKATVSAHGLIKGKIYEVISEYGLFYELKLDAGIHCRPKFLFEIVNEAYNIFF